MFSVCTFLNLHENFLVDFVTFGNLYCMRRPATAAATGHWLKYWSFNFSLFGGLWQLWQLWQLPLICAGFNFSLFGKLWQLSLTCTGFNFSLFVNCESVTTTFTMCRLSTRTATGHSLLKSSSTLTTGELRFWSGRLVVNGLLKFFIQNTQCLELLDQ